MIFCSYNIGQGGYNSYGDPSPFPERIDLLKQVINDISADFVGLIDTYRWDDIYSNEEIANMFSYKHAYCVNLDDDRLKKKGHNNGITVLTNLSVVRFQTISLSTRNAVKTRVKVDDNYLDVYTIYLDDLSEDTRLKQANALLNIIDNSIPTIVMGDLNTLDKNNLPEIDYHIEILPKKDSHILKAFKPIIHEMKRGEVIELLKNHGLVSADTTGTPTAPTRLFHENVSNAFLKIDYALHTNKIDINNFEVLKNPLLEKASDHYPIVFDVGIVSV